MGYRPHCHSPREKGKDLDFCIARAHLVQIFVRTPSGSAIALAVDASDTVEATKCKIEARDGLPVNRQRLVFNWGEMSDEKSLRDYNDCRCSVLA